MKEKIINYIETLEAKSLQVDDYFKQRNELYIENQKKDKEIEKLDNILENIGYQIEGLLYHTDEKSVISKHNGKVLKNILKMIETRNVSIKIENVL